MRLDASLAYLFCDRPLVERFAAARAAGFTGVELHGCENASIEALAAAAQRAGVAVASCNAPVGDLLDGGPGLSGVPGREADFEHAIRDAARTAQALGCPNVNVGPSRIRAASDREASLATLSANLAVAGDILGEHGIRATLESINPIDANGVLINTLSAALTAVERAAHPNVYLVFDIYHVAQTDPAPLNSLERAISRVAHVQFADVPGRGPPGTGTIDFHAFFAALRRLGYTGWIGAEFRPQTPEHSDCAWLSQFFETPTRMSSAAHQDPHRAV